VGDALAREAPFQQKSIGRSAHCPYRGSTLDSLLSIIVQSSLEIKHELTWTDSQIDLFTK